jgi:hypothetical protein
MKKISFSSTYPRRHKKEFESTGFIKKILDGVKTSTIRKVSTREVGDVLQAYHWAGMPYMTKHVDFAQIKITSKSNISIIPDKRRVVIFQNNKANELNQVEIEFLSKREGFETVNDFFDWFYFIYMGATFEGYLYNFELID